MSSQVLDNHLVERIVEEVVKRIRQLMNEKHVVVIGEAEEAKGPLGLLVNSLKETGYTCHHYDEVSLHEAKFKLEVSEGLVVGCLTIAEARKLSLLDIDSPKLKVVYEALRLGKTVYVLSEDFNLTRGSKLGAPVGQIRSTLEDMGVKLLGQKSTSADISAKVITAEDLKNLNHQQVVIREDAILTYGAREYLKTHQIRIERK